MGSVDLGILAETTPVVWRDALWLMECIQGGRYYGNINSATYPNQPQPSGYLRFTNVVTGEHTKPFAEGYGLANALEGLGRYDEARASCVCRSRVWRLRLSSSSACRMGLR